MFLIRNPALPHTQHHKRGVQKIIGYLDRYVLGIKYVRNISTLAGSTIALLSRVSINIKLYCRFRFVVENRTGQRIEDNRFQYLSRKRET